MQVREFKAVLTALGETLRDPDREIVHRFAAAFPDRPGTVAAFLIANREIQSNGAGNGDPRVEDALPILERFVAFVRTVAKQAVATDYEAALAWAREHRRWSLSELARLATRLAPPPSPAAALREEIVREYAEALRAGRIGEQAFGELLDKLGGDPKVRKLEMVEIARRTVDSEMALSTAKAAALKRIRLEHDAYRDSAARSNAVGGKSAG